MPHRQEIGYTALLGPPSGDVVVEMVDIKERETESVWKTPVLNALTHFFFNLLKFSYTDDQNKSKPNELNIFTSIKEQVPV